MSPYRIKIGGSSFSWFTIWICFPVAGYGTQHHLVGRYIFFLLSNAFPAIEHLRCLLSRTTNWNKIIFNKKTPGVFHQQVFERMIWMFDWTSRESGKQCLTSSKNAQNKNVPKRESPRRVPRSRRIFSDSSLNRIHGTAIFIYEIYHTTSSIHGPVSLPVS